MKLKLIFLILTFVEVQNFEHLQAQEQLPDTVWMKNFGEDGLRVELVKFSPDGKYLYAIAENCENCKLKINALTGIIVDTIDVPCNQISFSPTGDTVVFVAGNKISFIDYHTNKVIDTILIDNYMGIYGLITPNGKHVIISPYKNGTDIPQILIYDIATKKMIKSFTGRYNYAFDLNISPDGRFLSFNDFRGLTNFAVVIDLLTYEEKIIIKESNDFEIVGFTSDNKYLILMKWGINVVFYDTENFQLQKNIDLSIYFPSDQPSPGIKSITADSKYLIGTQANGEYAFNTVFVMDIERESIKYVYNNIPASTSMDVSPEGYIACSGFWAYVGNCLTLLRPNWKFTTVNEQTNSGLSYSINNNLLKINFDFPLIIKPITNIFDYNGKLIVANPVINYLPGKNFIEINIEHLPNAVYLIDLLSDEHNYKLKILKN